MSKIVTLCFPIRESEVLLGMKKSGHGQGMWNGFGGKVEPNETIIDAAVRELFEESHLQTTSVNLQYVARILLSFVGNLRFICHVYLVSNWSGQPSETTEMQPRWFSINQLPADTMWPADRLWIPRVLDGEMIEVEINYNHDGSAVTTSNIRPTTFDVRAPQ